jgi:hypothetical protein
LILGRRRLLGWIVSLTGSFGILYLFRFVYRGFGSTEKLLRRLRAQPSRERRLRYRSQPVWSDKSMVINTKPLPGNGIKGIIHWPHPDLLKLRYKVKPLHARNVAAVNWRAELQKAGQRFNKRHSGAILERLALAEVNLKGDEASRELTGLEQAVEVLRIACNLPENRKNRRLFELLARLLCLQYPQNTQQAFDLLLAAGLPPGFSYLTDRVHFELWHEKTVSRFYLRKIEKRIREAQNLVHSASSSGEDTA